MRLVLKETSGEIDVRLIASINKWQLISEHQFQNNTPHQIQWVFNNDTIVVFVEDFLLNLNYLYIQGVDYEMIKLQVQKGLEIYDEKDIELLRSDKVEKLQKCTLINVVALMAPQEFDNSYYEIILEVLYKEDIDVQRVAIFAVSYIPWMQFKEVLIDLKMKYPELADDIQIIIQSNDTHGWL